MARNQTGKRKVVVIVRERNGHSVPPVFRTEGQAQADRHDHAFGMAIFNSSSIFGAKVVSHGRYDALQMAEVTVPRNLFADILRMMGG